MSVALLRMRDLRARGIVNNWTSLTRYQKRYGFPMGRVLGRSRVWTEDQIAAWLETLPSVSTLPLPHDKLRKVG